MTSRNFLIVSGSPPPYTRACGGNGQVKVKIEEGGVPASKRLRAHVQRSLDFALSGSSERIGSVIVRLSHAAAGLGGGAQRCEIEAVLRPRSVRAEDSDVDVFAAVDNASRRLQRSMNRALDREREWSDDAHSPPSHPATPPAVAARPPARHQATVSPARRRRRRAAVLSPPEKM